ncbi:MAG: fused MFS/spermidine synthase [Casimicrobiaceae bacterium]|nr:fused MFS/spermidine synthase [Casimicrobiaceae bacterium]
MLFLVQPLIAKQILPWFGGSSAVWTTCLLFFQAALLAGYAYSDAAPRALGARRHALLHIGVALLALASLPILAPETFKPTGLEEPIVRILLLLAVTIGLPYFVLSTTSPLIQAWFARLEPGRDPYRLFALSNGASLAALLAYPVVIEPFWGTREQALGWSALFVGFVSLLVALALRVVRAEGRLVGRGPSPSVCVDASPPSVLSQLHWLALSAVGSMMLLAVSNHITQNVASVPLLWVLPLALYLLSFILTFDGRGWYKRERYVGPFFVVVATMAALLVDKTFQFDFVVQTSVFCVGLFIVCMVLHGELVGAKPEAAYLTRFYLLVAAGGALGALVVSVGAPLFAPTYLEVPVALWLAALLFIPVATAALGVLQWLAVALAVGVFAAGAWFFKQEHAHALAVTRNFYGVLKVKAYGAPESEDRLVRLVHGAILHGEQFPHEKWRAEPTTYYTPTSGFGRAVNDQRLRAPRSAPTLRIGMIGLGVGTVGAYCRRGDVCRIYEINPEVESLARRHFTYLADAEARGAQLSIILGDARLSLEREVNNVFNVLAVDAFSSDSIPMHLITREAVRTFMKQVASDGVLAYHVSNRFLDLPPVLAEIAYREGLAGVVVEDPSQPNNALHSTSTWVLLARNSEVLAAIEGSRPLERRPGAPLWTDDFNNLLAVIKWRH